ncbi:MAG: sulfotransferase domain-containing protein [Alphaproteobacteria bacterium]|nr:sulfotransferase domain-containing protein [Alphaproteobacteria bacterium]
MKKDADIELAFKNIPNLTEQDIILASYPGCGSSLLGGILIELGIDYIEGYQEQIVPNQLNTNTVNPMWRSHWPQLAKKYDKEMIGLRGFKTHFYPESFENAAPKKAILLIRDARDAVISYYNWRKNFSDETGTLYDFISRDGYYGKKPFDDWAEYIDAWEKWGKAHELLIVKYEDLKFTPEFAIREILSFLNIHLDNTKIQQAIENVSFSKIQQDESKSQPHSNKKIFRKGLVGEWRGVLSNNMFSFIKKNTLEKLFRFGYEEKSVQLKTYPCTYILPKDGTVAPDDAYIIKEPIKPCFLGTLHGTVYVGIDTREIIRSVQYICETRNQELQFL